MGEGGGDPDAVQSGPQTAADGVTVYPENLGARCRFVGCDHDCTIGEQVLSECVERVGKVRGGPYCPAHLRYLLSLPEALLR